MRDLAGSKNPAWKGGKTRNGRYVVVLQHDHHRADPNGYVKEHVLIAEAVLGRPLSQDHPVHHHDENGSNNSNTNLVICEDKKYHQLLHSRMNVIKKGGDPDIEKWCPGCERLLPFTRFHRDRRQGDGLNRQCKQCAIVRACLNYRGKHPLI